jgi:hypothetical protein
MEALRTHARPLAQDFHIVNRAEGHDGTDAGGLAWSRRIAFKRRRGVAA